jgi:hypothetical protein
VGIASGPYTEPKTPFSVYKLEEEEEVLDELEMLVEEL